MITLGIDPGSHRIGYAFMERSQSRVRPVVLEYGTIEIPPKTLSPANLILIQAELNSLIEKIKPDRACVENLFFSKNKKTAQQVYEARGVILLILGMHQIPIYELTANQIKKGISASGSADKKAIRRSIQLILGMTPEGHDDSWDAIACAFVGLAL
ncbi:crossover junction endodeoxyribonuclease RuvC [Leptospira sp. GIMC2001]|uniref:crossover junction endodeoxyribonuclease RuvC n=1 Tax=Leptospira sp. GIMC2001 TaxID=1513297 RepID=UPI00234BD403|nr:crossover junction endodeoxyribonuclease RuvC [Leptospira sp. GIMC2001]WCL49827.1 crossover junction endodeoxyribonuclease RuvC [Leptospira sp. GIMC2001]